MKFLILLTVLFFMSCGDATNIEIEDTRPAVVEPCSIDSDCGGGRCFQVYNHTDKSDDNIYFLDRQCLIDCDYHDNKTVKKGYYERPFYTCHYYTEEYFYGGIDE